MRCDKCKWWKVTGTTKRYEVKMGYCRRFLPTAQPDTEFDCFAITLCNNWCGEFRERTENEFLIRATEETEALESLASKIKQGLESAYPDNKAEVRRVEMVGPKVGKDLREKALFAMFFAILFIVVYISGRFELKWMLSIIMAFMPVSIGI